MRRRGVMVDYGRLTDAIVQVREEKKGYDRILKEEFGITNTGWKQVKRVMMEVFKSDSETSTADTVLDTWVVDTTKDFVFDELQLEKSRFAKAVLGSRSMQKADTTVLKGVFDALSMGEMQVYEGRILIPVHPEYRLWATVTGRIVIDHPMLTNFPAHTSTAAIIRSIFVPRPGYVWFHYDYSQFELRVYASIWGDKGMYLIFTIPLPNGDPRDPHGEVGYKIHAEEYEYA